MNLYNSLKKILQTATLTIALAGTTTSLEACIATYQPPTTITQEMNIRVNNEPNQLHTYYATEEEGERQLSDIARTITEEDAFLFVKERNLWIDIGEGPLTEEELEHLSSKHGKKGIGINPTNLRSIVKEFGLKGQEVRLYHQHPDTNYTKNIQEGIIKGTSILQNFPSALDYTMTNNIARILRTTGAHPLPPRVVGSMYTIEFQQTRKTDVREVQNTMNTALAHSFSSPQQKRSIQETIGAYIEKLKE